MIYDFILVGHGLAGGILARTLSQQGYRIAVFDTYKANAASRVAAGLINPLAGKRFAKSWLAEKLVPFAITFYQQMEQELGIRVWHPLPILKLFSSVEEQNTWMGKSSNPTLHEFIKKVHVHLPASEVIEQEFGAIEITQSGYVDVNLLLDSLLAELVNQQYLVKMPFEYEKLQVTPNFVTYSLENNTIKAQKIVFCEGYAAIHNPYFNWLPFSPNKGEVLEIKTDNLSAECIYNKAVYVLPIGANRFKVGATYNWREINEDLSVEALTELRERTGQIVKKPFEVTNQAVGIRPAVRDRRPLIGWHPMHPNVGIFNGMGSKGVMMAPYLASNFTQNLTGGKLEPEADITRYLKHLISI
ncbi:FAD-dependent oxidoreductase [Adhaeribacter arboris]|uniref:FAD-dependent oxidoreductase n=1 Tax=Adhaeribacter arboris TaxID=2072846 RepID=A0A2T2YFW3_9BACT|nr:FAD-dependent oxidoreductase [Adhaeribacter arboris]PSR54383.1 FAD-dependent oxidoreductase [Adhaeribacter arboris]